MTARTQRADPPLHQPEGHVLPGPEAPAHLETGFDQLRWEESRAESDSEGAGGRAVLGGALVALAILWVGFTAWSAGSSLAGQSLSSPAIAQWIAIATGPLALLGLAWIMFGRTRRKEAERFTRSVIAMRTEARSLEALLRVLSQRINDSYSELGAVSQRLMHLGDEATGRLSSVTRELSSSSELMARHGQALDRAAESARNDVAVLLDDLPRAEAAARSVAEELRGAGSTAGTKAAEFAEQVSAISERTREAEEVVGEAAQRLVTHLTHIESTGAAAAARVKDAEASFTTALDSLLERTSATLEEIRSGIDTQSAAVTALVDQAATGIGRAGTDSADRLAASVAGANQALDGLAARLTDQERASRRITAETARALGELDRNLGAFAEQGDQRSAEVVAALGRARAEIQRAREETAGQDEAIQDLAARTTALREAVDEVAAQVRGQLATAIVDVEGGATRLAQSAETLRPELEWMREAAGEASDQIAASATRVAEQQDRFAAMLANIEEGVGSSESRLAALSSAIAKAHAEALHLGNETAPVLVAAMVQVREASAHAAERAREAIAAIVPESADALSEATRDALEKVIRESVEDRLRDVEATAAKAVEAARAASDRLTQQMLAIGQSATALERHIERTEATQREKDSEAFARRVALLIDSMHSAAIDVGKILADEVDEKAWESYLKGNRGVFTRRAVRLMEGGESRAIRAHYEADGEFQQSVNRYIHDFEAMLRRVLAEREGGMLAVTLMSSDMGKLYAAVAQAIERRR